MTAVHLCETDAPVSDVDLLRRTAIFCALDAENLMTLATSLERRLYLKGQLIVQPGGSQAPVVVVARGSVRVYRISTMGHEVTLDSLEVGDIYGLITVDCPSRAKDFLEASSDGTEACHIPPRCLQKIMLAHPHLALSVLDVVSRRLLDARDRIEDLALHDLKTRLAHTLARLAMRGEQYEVSATRRELAWMVGAREEEVTKSLRHLRDHGLVAYEPRSTGIVVRDPETLLNYGDDRL